MSSALLYKYYAPHRASVWRLPSRTRFGDAPSRASYRTLTAVRPQVVRSADVEGSRLGIHPPAGSIPWFERGTRGGLESTTSRPVARYGFAENGRRECSSWNTGFASSTSTPVSPPATPTTFAGTRSPRSTRVRDAPGWNRPLGRVSARDGPSTLRRAEQRGCTSQRRPTARLRRPDHRREAAANGRSKPDSQRRQLPANHHTTPRTSRSTPAGCRRARAERRSVNRLYTRPTLGPLRLPAPADGHDYCPFP